MNFSSRSLCYAVLVVVLSATITTPLRAQLLGAGRSDGDAPIIIRPDEDADSPDADLVFAADAEQGGAPQGQRELSLCSSKDFQHVAFVPPTCATLHDNTVLGSVLLEQ